jgi:hypothetical protein
VARGHAIGVEVLRRFQQVLELHPFVAADAGHRRGAGEVAVGEFVDHRLAEGVLVVEHVMGKAHLLGHAAGVVDVAARAAGALLGQRRAVIVELQGDAHHVIAFLGQLAATTELSTPPDMATTTRVSAGGLAKPSELSVSGRSSAMARGPSRAVDHGLISETEARQTWHLSEEELEEWRGGRRHGVAALRATALQRYRGSRGGGNIGKVFPIS